MSPYSRLSPRLVIAIAFAALAFGLFASSAVARKAYTLNYNEGSISVIDTQTNQVVGSPIPIGEGPYSIAITPNGKTAYAANRNSEDISVVDLQTEQTAPSPIVLNETPNVIAISPDGRTAYVTTESENVVVIDTQTNQVLTSIPIGEAPWGVAFPPDGNTAYVANFEEETVSVIDTQTRQVVGTIPVGEEPWGVAITPDGTKAYVSNYEEETVSVIDTQTRQVIGSPIPVGEEPYEVAITPDGKTVYVANYSGETVTAIDTQTNQPIATIPVSGGPWQIVVAPDQSPVASFSAGAATAGVPVAFNGSGSSDPDGSVVTYNWLFGDGVGALNGGATPLHTYASPGNYSATLSVVDNEGCSTSQRFTGRTTYCGETGQASKTQTVEVKAAPVSNKFKFGKLKLNRHNGTAKLQVVVPGAGMIVLNGKKVRFVKRKATKAGKVTLNIRPKTKLNKALKRIHRARVHFHVTFSPTGGTPATQGKTINLIRQAH